MNENAPGPRPAATVMLAAERAGAIEYFMVRRSAASAFLPGMYVFPGGAVDDGDRALAGRRLLRAPQSNSAGREGGGAEFEVAALREAFEEAGILLARVAGGRDLGARFESLATSARRALLDGTQSFEQLLEANDLVLDGRHLVYFSRWVTPPSEPRRFDTRFYLALAPADQVATACEIETLDGVWIAPREALRRHTAGDMPMIFPTLMHLRRLESFTSFEDLTAFAATKPIAAVNPVMSGERNFAVPAELEDKW